MAVVSSPAVRTGAKRVASFSALAAEFKPGERVFLPGAAGEAVPLVEAFCTDGAPPVDLTGSFVPGINPIPAERLVEGSTFTCMFTQPVAPGTQTSGRLRHLPLSYGGFTAHLRDRGAFDTCVVQVAPPDSQGRCSLGLAVEFVPIVIARSQRIVAVINSNMPSLANSPSIPFADFELVIDSDAPLRGYDVGAPSAQASKIADFIAEFIDDGAAVEVGLGKTPDALLRGLTGRRNIRLCSGMLSDGARALFEAGSLDPDWTHTCCVQVGTADYYKWLVDRPEFKVTDCEYTHSVPEIAKIPRFVGVNSAVTVDLFGQANLEMIEGRMISGPGGAPDFARGASLSPGGISVVALLATSNRGATSRIVPSLDGPCAVPRGDIDLVVTEFGAADLRGRNVIERGERLIEVAAPQHRGMLTDAFREICRRL